MDDPTSLPQNTTHDWAIAVDASHLARIRQDPATFAPGDVQHLVLEVVAYVADEAEASSGGQCVITFHRDGSVSVSDDGRGTDIHRDDGGHVTRKPIMATKDLRFFDSPDAQMLPEWLVHTNHRRDGAWTQRYEHGIPVTGLLPIPGRSATRTTVHFRPDQTALTSSAHPVIDTAQLAASWPELLIEIRHEQDSR